ncbi:peptidoglycan-binding protein [Streptomyces sp. SP17BM10]|uniref:peptidoglycan-binding protein n=1 Tax=Streptomyces sp. SP17BM10 TaxID=3002530 RepID=UPI002E7957D0|nr:peptidoglycan-binding protein [Streptomyces sp. SP17BM10]MEE1788061.1 peptidoglycan-binding protein [Streptomyces sp. SP17BM10]
MTGADRPSPLLEFVEVEPGDDCICGGCNARRRARLHAAPVHEGGHAAARSIRRRAAVLVAAVGTAMGGGAAAATAAVAAPAPNPGGGSSATPQNPQGDVSSLYGEDDGGTDTAPRTVAQPVTRAQIIQRAQSWVDQRVPYSMGRYWSDGYRQDCSGFVSMAWGLNSSQTTWTLPNFAERIGKTDLQPGDVLIYNNSASPQAGSHATIFGGWTDSTRTRYIAYEQTSPGTTKRSTPYAYWNNSGAYLPYRYTGLSGAASSDGVPATAFPGADKFGPGANNAYVTRLGQMLVQRGGARFYAEGPGPQWGEADRRATQAFQLAQGWRGGEADGLPGKDTWDYLVNGKGRNIDAGTPLPPPPPPSSGAPAYPGADAFGPGANNDYVRQLGEQLVRKGYGGAYTVGPGPQWGESDRANVQSFQQAQGWSGTDADGIPGPETWRLLFS